MAVTRWIFAASLLIVFFVSAAANSENNPADGLVAVLNTNRTAHKSSSLHDNPGLGCIAIQYIKAFQGKCDDVGGSNAKRPADAEFAQTFAPNCGVQVSTLAPITGRLIGCQSKYVSPKEFFNTLIHNQESLDILYSKNHTEVGAAVAGTDGGAPFFWCILFSSGNSTTSFALDGGVAKSQHPGCFSGTDDDCSGAHALISNHLWPYTLGISILLWVLFA